jgi:hypothetical protein
MPTQYDPSSEQPIRVTLTEPERDLLLSLLTIEFEVERLLAEAGVNNGIGEILLSREDLDELIGTVAFESNHTEDRKLQNQLDALYEKLDGRLRGL